MKQFIFIFILAIFLCSCMGYQSIYSIIPENTAETIPLTANKIIVKNDNSLTENYTMSYKSLLALNYRIDNDNKEMGYILASKKDIGDTEVRLNMVCEDNTIKITSEWTAGTQTAILMGAMSGMAAPQMTWYNAQWNRKSDKSTVAFANAVKVANTLGNELTFETLKSIQKNWTKESDPLYD